MRRVLTIVITALLVVVLPSAAWAGQAKGGHSHPGNGHPGHGHGKGTSWYLAMGDSLAAGYQPGVGDDRDGGYVGGVLDALQRRDTHGKPHHLSAPRTTPSPHHGPTTKLRNISCSGATTTSLMGTDRCTYRAGSQLAEGVQFLKAHKNTVDLVTIDIGANDVTPCARPTVDVACALTALATVERNLTATLSQLRAATGPRTEIVVLNYYNPFLAVWLTGPEGQQAAAQSTVLQGLLNAAVARSAATVSAQVADVATAFRSADTTPVATAYGTIPTNVATICAWTWMCTKSDIHANDDGYAVLARTVAARLR